MTASRKSWLDPEGGIAIDDYARQLESYLEAVADGVVTDDEIRSQEKRVADLMREIEPKLDDATHEKITRLLCEMTVYDIMQLLHLMQEARGKTTFRG
jgi:predicted thioredoxin/glutaredoxin